MKRTAVSRHRGSLCKGPEVREAVERAEEEVSSISSGPWGTTEGFQREKHNHICILETSLLLLLLTLPPPPPFSWPCSGAHLAEAGPLGRPWPGLTRSPACWGDNDRLSSFLHPTPPQQASGAGSEGCYIGLSWVRASSGLCPHLAGFPQV